MVLWACTGTSDSRMRSQQGFPGGVSRTEDMPLTDHRGLFSSYDTAHQIQIKAKFHMMQHKLMAALQLYFFRPPLAATTW